MAPMPGSYLPVALVQLDATDDVAANIARAAALADEAAAAGARLVALPGVPPVPRPRRRASGPRPARSRGRGRQPSPRWPAGATPGSWSAALAETVPDPARPYNTSVLIAPDGSIAATYRKIHLFDVAVDDGPVDTEVGAGHRRRPCRLADVDGVDLGLTICYDLRFPELYRALALAGAQVLTVPANFTERTGRDHWEVLLRARAIENGAYVLAPSQIGGPPGQPAYGRSMIIDPWGTVVAQAPDGVAIVHADARPVAGRRRPARHPGPRELSPWPVLTPVGRGVGRYHASDTLPRRGRAHP